MNLEIPPKKDMQKVEDYNRKRQLEIFKGQCFNNACVLYQGKQWEIKIIFNLAQELYDEGIKRGWV